jgi:hypothetical protein
VPFLNELSSHCLTARSARQGLARAACHGLALASLASAPLAQAQTWAQERSTPALGELVAVDATGEPNWLFGPEDVARDGLNAFGAAEQARDIRSVYAALDGERLWLRVYVSDATAPQDLRVHVFFDIDQDSASGGAARLPDVDGAPDNDGSAGGYEVVLELQAGRDGIEAWRWNDAERSFQPLADTTDLQASTEVGSDLDPLRLRVLQNGYLQAAVRFERLDLTRRCEVDLLVRSSDELGQGDLDVGGLGPCVPGDLNENGLADVAETEAACTTNDQCPGGGACLEGQCRAPDLVLAAGERVQGGAFTCGLAPGASKTSGNNGLWAIGLLGVLLASLRRAAPREQARG